ncbi:MAG: spore germination protein [Ruminococcus sp.]|nr:spore germination protein [Ruminococcus sp.]
MYNSLKENINTLQASFSGSADFTLRNMILKSDSNTSAAVVTIEGMCNKEVVAISIINPILEVDYKNLTPDEILEKIKLSVLSATEIVEFETFREAVMFSTSGFAIFAVDGCEKMLAIGVQGFSFRSVSEPETEVVQRGSREGFTEPLRINMTLIRRRIKSTDLVFETMTSGDTSRTQLCLCYLQKSVSESILNELKRRLNFGNLKMVLASGYLSEYLEDTGCKSVFSGVGISERPDTVCGKLMEGRIAILVDGTPAALIVPHIFVEEFQSVDDYSNRPYYASFIRILKYISFFISVFLPGIYTAFAQFHPEYFPEGLLLTTSKALADTPLPVTLEVLLIMFVYEIMREAGLRIPKSLSHAVSIVGALVIGESAVNAGFIGSSTLMIVATAAICSYVTSSLYPQITFFRFAYVIVGGVFGLWGIVLLGIAVLINMCAKTSFGVPYMSSLAPFSYRRMRDVFIRGKWKNLSRYTIKVQNFPETEEY